MLSFTSKPVFFFIFRVQHYRSKFRNYRFDQRPQHPHLNSCGNSECSDEEEVEVRGVTLISLDQFVIPYLQDASPTSVFKVYNSSCSKVEGGLSPHLGHKSPDIFSWAAAQQIQHDHNYCHEMVTDDAQFTVIDHGTVNMNNIQW